MNNARIVLQNILKWAEKEEKVRGLVLVGSRAIDQADELSDFDINMFLSDTESFLHDDQWIKDIANIWVYSPDKYMWENVEVPTRLVIYEGGIKVDYSLWDKTNVTRLSESDFYDTGYKVLIDKDKLCVTFRRITPTPQIKVKPSEEEFMRLVKEYWFEAYHVAKYLKREDLWLVKLRDYGSVKYYLLKVMEWYMLSKNNWNYDTKWDGKHIKMWLDKNVYEDLFKVFAHFDAEDSWNALIENNRLFSKLAKQTAQILHYHYPSDVDENITNFTLQLKAGSE
jgi:aminoglycoside 6-adenylyltransferase